MADIKVCTVCKTGKPVLDFGVQSSRPDGLRGECIRVACAPCNLKKGARLLAA